MSQDRVAVVTGANKGIGFEICRQLARKETQVVLTARDEQKGKRACQQLTAENLRVTFHQLDVTVPESIDRLQGFIENAFGRLDILVNNAGISIDNGMTGLDVDPTTVRQTLETNLVSPLRLSQAFIPLMQKNKYGRIVNVSSRMGALSEMQGGYAAYRISKAGLNAVTRILSAETQNMNILVNSMHPGWVRTDMGGAQAPRTVEEGADTAVWLATLPADGPTGKFFQDREEIAW